MPDLLKDNFTRHFEVKAAAVRDKGWGERVSRFAVIIFSCMLFH